MSNCCTCVEPRGVDRKNTTRGKPSASSALRSHHSCGTSLHTTRRPFLHSGVHEKAWKCIVSVGASGVLFKLNRKPKRPKLFRLWLKTLWSCWKLLEKIAFLLINGSLPSTTAFYPKAWINYHRALAKLSIVTLLAKTREIRPDVTELILMVPNEAESRRVDNYSVTWPFSIAVMRFILDPQVRRADQLNHNAEADVWRHSNHFLHQLFSWVARGCNISWLLPFGDRPRTAFAGWMMNEYLIMRRVVAPTRGLTSMCSLLRILI